MDDRCAQCLLVLDEGRRHNCRTRKCPDCGALPDYPHEEECPRLIAAYTESTDA